MNNMAFPKNHQACLDGDEIAWAKSGRTVSSNGNLLGQVMAVFAFFAGAACAQSSAGVELVSNGSFENGRTDWSFAIFPGEGVRKYDGDSSWVSPDMQKKDGAGSYCAMLQSKNLSTYDTMTQAVSLPAGGLYAFSCAYAARTVTYGGTFWGGTTSVVLRGIGDRPHDVRLRC